MHGLDDHADPTGLEHLLDRAGHLLGEPLLHLQAPGEDLDEPRQLREPNDLAGGNVGDVDLTEKREHVVLAQRIHLDVAHHDHALVPLLEDGIPDDVGGVERVAPREPRERLRDTLRSLDQAVTRGVFAE